MLLTVALVAAALVTATLSGMAGMGGGAILIAVMFAIGMPPALALPLHAGVQLASNASRSIVYSPHVRWGALGLFMLTAVPGPFLVAPLVVDANPDWIRLIMAAFIAMAVWPTWAQRLKIHGRGGLLAAGAIAGVVGPVVGARRAFWSRRSSCAMTGARNRSSRPWRSPRPAVICSRWRRFR